MSIALNTRLRSLAQTTPALAPEQARQIAKEHGVSVTEVQGAFAAQQANLKAAVHINENIGQQTATLREQSGGGLFGGQKTASSASTPALQGKNLSAPGDAVKEHFAPILDGLRYLTDRVKQGRLSSPALDVEAQALFAKAGPIGDRAYAELWSPAGNATRQQLLGALDGLAKVLPHAVIDTSSGIAGRTVQFDALHLHLIDAQHRHDGADVARYAGALATSFPNDPLAPWAAGLAGNKA
jgi:hypothetical protein